MARPFSNGELFAAIRAWCAANYPGCPLKYLTLHLRHVGVPIQLASIDGVESEEVEPGSASTEDKEGRVGLDRCTQHILRTLRECGRPLSKTRLLEEMMRLGFEWSESTVCRRLAQLMEDGTIENPEEVKPRGYRLVE